MRILTVRQPWAWAIIHGGKDVENRVRNIAGSYRGPVAIHVAQADADGAPESAWKAQADFYRERAMPIRQPVRFIPGFFDRGMIIGVVDLTAAHITCPPTYDPERGLCSTWAQRDHWHLHLSNPRALSDPIPYKGALGLRALDADTISHIEAAIA